MGMSDNMELMTDTEREEYFNRDESLIERWNAFTSESYFAKVISGVKSIPTHYSTATEWLQRRSVSHHLVPVANVDVRALCDYVIRMLYERINSSYFWKY